ncbi:MAG: RdgB/HAM1 family non-canonical purine NTP pyrophosphatase [bacterium]|nr:RdgB/HAM1 family non-canonical purine NTP pyrophosphatase [bacterium]
MNEILVPQRVLIASGNNGKVREFEFLLRPMQIALVTVSEYPHIPQPEETGMTFAANAELKATHYALQTGEWSIADDSGLEIDILNGRPGVLSARYGGAETPYAEKMRLMLDELVEAADDQRGAQFISVIALADPSGKIRLTAEGVCRGSITGSPRGSNGFGYDPIFQPDGFNRTFGEMSDDEKRLLSHRGKASFEFIRKMSDFTGV